MCYCRNLKIIFNICATLNINSDIKLLKLNVPYRFGATISARSYSYFLAELARNLKFVFVFVYYIFITSKDAHDHFENFNSVRFF